MITWKQKILRPLCMRRFRLHCHCMSVKVGNLFQVQDRNLRGCSDLSLCSSLFVSCDPCCGLWAAYFPRHISARLPVHHMNMASQSKLVFPVYECIYLRKHLAFTFDVRRLNHYQLDSGWVLSEYECFFYSRSKDKDDLSIKKSIWEPN